MHIVVPPRKKCLRWQRLWSYVSDCEWWFLLTIGTTLWLLVLIQTIEGGPACCLNHRCCVEITVKNNSINNNGHIEHVMICSMGIGVVCHATQHPGLTVERKHVFIMNSFFLMNIHIPTWSFEKKKILIAKHLSLCLLFLVKVKRILFSENTIKNIFSWTLN